MALYTGGLLIPAAIGAAATWGRGACGKVGGANATGATGWTGTVVNGEAKGWTVDGAIGTCAWGITTGWADGIVATGTVLGTAGIDAVEYTGLGGWTGTVLIDAVE